MVVKLGHRLLTVFIFLFLFTKVHAQNNIPYVFEKEFKNCLKRNYSEKEFLRFNAVIDSLENIVDLTPFKNYQAYTSNMSKLVNSINNYQKGMSYRLIATLKDRSYNALLAERLPTEENKFLKTLNAVALIRLSPKHTTVAFDYLVDHEDFATSQLIPLYMQMDTKSIVKTAHARVKDPRLKAKVLALQTMARFDTNPGVDTIIVNAIRDWDIKIKGYAIVALSVHKKGNFKTILAPYYKEPALREVILQTLEQSPTGEDVLYAEELKRKKK